jgi:GH18 family chitinase
MRKYLNDEEKDKGNLIFSASIGCRKPDLTGYEINEISSYLDFINLMTFDLRGIDDETATHHSPL